MKSGDEFAKHLISGGKSREEMKHPMNTVTRNTFVRDSMRQTPGLYFVTNRFTLLNFGRGKKILLLDARELGGSASP